MKARKKKRVKLPPGCPKCGGAWTRVSGILRCGGCGHVRGSQNPSFTESRSVHTVPQKRGG